MTNWQPQTTDVPALAELVPGDDVYTRNGAEQLATFLHEDIDKWGKIINSSNIEMK